MASRFWTRPCGLYLDQVRTGPYPWEEPRSKRQGSTVYGERIARLLTLDRAVPFRVHAAQGIVEVRGAVGAIHDVTGGRVPEDSQIHDRSDALPAWTHTLPGLKSPVRIQAKSGFVYHQTSVAPEYDITVVGLRRPSGAIEAPPTGLVMYLASRERIERPRPETDGRPLAYALIVIGVMLLGLRWWARGMRLH